MKSINTPDLSNLSPEQKRQLLAKLLQKKAQQSSSKDPSDSSVESPSAQQQPIVHEPNRSSAPLSFAQQRLWFIDQLQPGQTVYSIPAVLKLEGDLQINGLRHCLNQIVARHDILRTQFIAVAGEPVQQIQPHLDIDLPVINIAASADADENNLASGLLPHCQALIAQPFDLEKGPLLRAQLLKLSKTEHVLVLVVHHIVADYWSLRVVMKEIALLYQAFAQAPSTLQLDEISVNPLAALPIQYGDYAAWQQRYVAEQTAGQLDYWLTQLASPPAVLQLPIDRPRPAMQTFSGAKHSFMLPASLRDRLSQLAQRSHATLFMLLLAAFQVLLARYSGQQDILVGSTVSDRDRSETQNLIGLFVNNLVFRANVTPEQSFETFLQQVKATTIQAYSHQDIPFEQVVDALDIDRQLSHNALFQAMFILHNTPKVSFELPNLKVTPVELDNKTARFDISLDMYESAAGLTGVFEYNTELFDADAIERLTGSFETLLTGLVSDPSTPVGSLSLLTPAEIAAQNKWNQTQVDIPQQSVYQLIEAQAEKTPDAIALSFNQNQSNNVSSLEFFSGQSWTYQQLNQKANQLAHYLTAQGIQPGDRVAIALDRSPALVTALLSVLKLGGTYIPLDPTHPASRLGHILGDAQVNLILEENDSLTSRLQASKSLASQVKTLDIQTYSEEIQHQPVDNPAVTIQPDNLAYIIYTSGSTGKPKGVPIRHHSLVNLLSTMAKAPGVTAEDSLLAVTTVAFDIATLELLLPLIVGARLVIASADTVRDSSLLIAQLENDNITIMQATPATWRLLLDSGWKGADTLKILCGGEALDLALAMQLLPCCRELWNLYGPTETTIWSSAIQLNESLLSNGFVPIGGPTDNTEFYIVDKQQQPVPIGVSGELLIGGLGLTPGYLNRPNLTADRFIPNPFQTLSIPHSPTPPCSPAPLLSCPSTLYKTGDRLRRHSNGTLEYLGRFDHQVKLRGYRIELDDIETALTNHPDIDQAVVMLHKEQDASPQLAAYCKVWSDVDIELAADSNIRDIRQHLTQQLPAYMVPAAYALLHEFPLTPNGKINRKGLPQPTVITASADAFIEPKTDTERAIARLWADILQVERVGAGDNFFELGGHSLLAAKVVAQLGAIYQKSVSLRALFESQTLADFAAAVDSLESDRDQHNIEQISRTQPLPLSYAQQRQWVLAQLEPESPFYNIPAAVKLTGNLSITLLEQALDQLCQQHEELRTVFRAVDGKAQLDILERVVPAVEQSVVDQLLDKTTIRELLSSFVTAPFDLESAPLMRVKVISSPTEQTHVISIVLHHIIADAASVALLMRELVQVYGCLQTKQSAELPALSLQYVDYAAWQQTLNTASQLAYWQRQLADVPPLLNLPVDFPRPAVQQFEGGTYRFQLPVELTAALSRLSQQNSATLYMTLMAAFQLLLHRYSDSEDILVGSPISQRPYPAFENVLGMFVNTLAIRGRFPQSSDQEPNFIELLRQIRTAALEAYANQDVPFEQVLEALPVDRNWSHSPLFQVMFVWQAAQPSAVERPDPLGGFDWEPIPLDSNATKVDLTLSMAETTEQDSVVGLSGKFEYRKDLFRHETTAAIADAFCTLLEAITQSPHESILSLPLVSQGQQQQLAKWNNTRRDYPSDVCLHQLFEQQVMRSPLATALITSTETLTYQTLNTRANQLSRNLLNQGVAPGSRIAICLDRTADLLIAILAVLKSGSAHVPMDPAYPQSRLTYILEDAQVAAVITHKRYEEILFSQLRATDSLVTEEPSNANSASYAPTNSRSPLEGCSKSGVGSAADATRRLPTPSATRPPLQRGFASGGDNLVSVIIERNASEEGHYHCITPLHVEENSKSTDSVAISDTISPDDLAYIIYTSGSTGQPKGVAIAHRSPVTLVQWASEAYAPEQLSGVLAATSVCFDLSIFEIFVPLSTGGCVILADSVLHLPEHPAAQQVTLVNTVPTAIAELIRLGTLPASVTTINLAGEPIPPALVRRLYQQPSVQHVYNLYGPSEDTTYSTYTLLSPADTVVPIGQPIANTQTFVIDERRNPVPIGMPGELLLGGSGLAQGYWNRPELTKEKFITVENISETPLYCTGDLVRRRPDGQLDFLGRIDNQVKVRGFRIELGEIEAALLSHPEIIQAAASVYADEQNNNRLAAYLVLANGEIFGAERLLPGSSKLVESVRSHLQTLLPNYMLPALYIPLTTLPLLPNGKVNRKALPTPISSDFPNEDNGSLTPTERTLAKIWQTLLNQSVERHDNFFELGGDSILAIQAIAQAKQSGLQFSPRDLFQNPTIAQLVTVAQSQSLPPVSQEAIVGSVPLTPMQQWFFQQPLTEPHHWNQSVLLSSRQPLQIDCLTQACKLLMKHHDGLRATFQQTGDRWQQHYLSPSDSIPLKVVTGSTHNCAQLIKTEAESAHASFDLSTGPLWKAVYFELEDADKQEYRLFITCHHLLVDGVSWRILLSDLQQIYSLLLSQSQDGASPSALSELSLFKTQSVKSWVEQLKAADFNDEIPYWKSVVSAHSTLLAVDFPDGQNTMASVETYSVALADSETHRLLKELPEAYSARTEDILLTALLLAFVLETGAPMRLSLEGHGRSENLDLSRTVGWFTTLYPVLFNLPTTDDLGALIKATKETLRAVPNQGIGYGALRYLQGHRLAEIVTETPVRFDYLGQTDQLFSADGLFSPAVESTGAARSPQDARDVLLEINAVVSKGVLTTHWTYSSNCHRAETITQWAQAYLSHLGALIDYCLSADTDRGYSPADFPQMGLGQGELDALLSSIGGEG